MSKRAVFGLLFGIMILASFFRLYHITTIPPGLYPDEAMDGNNALEVIQTGHFQTFYIEDNGREGLYVNILVFFIKALGNKPWVVRLPAAIAGILTVLGIYFLTAELFEKDEGRGARYARTKKSCRSSLVPRPLSQSMALLAAFLLATSFWHINFSRIGFRAILAPLCLIWAIYFFLKAMKSDEKKETRDKENSFLSLVARPISLATIAGIIFGVGFYTYIAYRIMPLLLLLFIPFFRKYPGFWKKFWVFVIVAFLVALPIGIYFLHHPDDFLGRTSEIAVTNGANPLSDFAVNFVKTAAMFNIRGDANWRHNVSGARELFWPVGILFIVGILLGLWSLCKRRRRDKGQATSARDKNASLSSVTFSFSLIFAWLLLAALPAAASNEGIPHALRSILMLPPAIMLAAIGGVWLYGLMKKYWNKNWANAIAIVFLASVAVFAYFDYFVTWAQNSNVPGSFNADYVTIGDQMNALPPSTPKYVVVNAVGVLARGIPVPAETVMFVTDSFTTSTQLAHHITYLLPDETSEIPPGTANDTIFYVH